MECKGCGKCCNVSHHPYLDVEVFGYDNVPLQFKEYRLGGTENKESWWLKRKSNGECVFLNWSKECSIYEFRPKECREFTQDHEVCKFLLENIPPFDRVRA